MTRVAIADFIKPSAAALEATIDHLRPRRVSAERFAASQSAGTVDDHVARYAAVADAGVDTAIVALADPGPHSVETFGRVIERLADR